METDSYQGSAYGTPRGAASTGLTPRGVNGGSGDLILDSQASQQFVEMWFWKEEDGQMKLDSYKLLSSHITSNQVRNRSLPTLSSLRLLFQYI